MNKILGEDGRVNLKDILVFLDVSSAGDERLRLATRIAKGHQACLSAVFLLDDVMTGLAPGPVVPEFGLAAGSFIPGATDISLSAIVAEDAEQRFRDWLRSFGVEGDWYPLARTDMAGLISLAQTADLVIMGQVNPNARHASAWRPEEIVVACGRPVLMVPYVGSFAQVGCRVLVAWDGSREAVRAVNDALPVISAAETVTIMTVRASAKDFERDRLPMQRIIRHLARHGIAASADETLRGGVPISDLLLSRAADLSADMVVAGAYHHSPLRETLIGGVSRDLFQHMTVPMLMSH